MATSTSGFADTWRKANDTFLAPFVTLPNLGLAATNASLGVAARLTEQAAQATGGLLGTPGEFAEQVSQRLANRCFKSANDSMDTIRKAIANATGQPSDTGSNQLLSSTLIDKTTATAALPLFVAVDAARTASEDVPAVKQGIYDTWLALSKFLDTRSSHGVLTGDLRADTDSQIRFGFYYMGSEGPIGAVARDFHGIVGGVVALGLGDFEWMAKAAKDYWVSMEYVYDKWLADETQPLSDFPIGPILSDDARKIISRFPRPFIAALDTGDPKRILESIFNDAGEIFTMLRIYPSTAFRVIYDVVVFIFYAWLQVSDALDYALCELAIVDSDLSDEDKDESMERLRKTAGNATVEFEYYVPLLVPLDGTPADQVKRTSVGGQLIDHHTIAQSVFLSSAINRAQAITGEIIQLRAFLWLFRDEKLARGKSYQETARKFGEEAARRIEAEPLYALSGQQVLDYMKPAGDQADGPRTSEEVKRILYECLRLRGLLYVADKVFENEPFVVNREQPFSADYNAA